MRTLEFEKLLMEPQGLEKVAERAQAIRQKYGETPEPEAAQTEMVDAMRSNLAPAALPQEVIDPHLHNDLQVAFAGFGFFPPEIVQQGPEEALSLSLDKYKKDPSEGNLMLLENAINRLTTAGELREEGRHLCDQAIALITSSLPTSLSQQKSVGSIWSIVYEHADFRGRGFFVPTPLPDYRKIRKSLLKQVRLHDRISSLYIQASAAEERGGEIILFEHDRFFGRFARFATNPGKPSERVNVPFVSGFINDRTSSILMVRHFKNEIGPFLIGDFFLRDEIKKSIESQKQIRLRGNPIVTWDMWPDGTNNHPNAPNQKFIYIRIPIRVDVPIFPDKDAEIRLWLYLYIDKNGRVQGYLAAYGAWVEAGWKSRRVLDELMKRLREAAPEINVKITAFITIFRLLEPYARLYYLPGKNSKFGHTDDDVILYLVRK